jgi:citrate lyase subunit beta / citryl-CoA lyase
MRLRSLLFVPGSRPDRFARAEASGADAIVLDLEDGVESSRKDEAREAIETFINRNPPGDAGRFVRVNAFASGWFDQDLELVGRLSAIAGVVLPKAESAAQIEAVARAIDDLPVLPLLETARGVLNAASIAAARRAIPALLFGAEDLSAQLGIPRTIDGDELLFARSQVALAAAAVGADAIDAVFVNLAAPDDLRRDARRARSLGFHGKMAIHPDQVPIINDVFTPTAAELERARRIVDAFERAEAQGEGVLRLDDQMVDAPIVARARRLLERART